MNLETEVRPDEEESQAEEAEESLPEGQDHPQERNQQSDADRTHGAGKTQQRGSSYS